MWKIWLFIPILHPIAWLHASLRAKNLRYLCFFVAYLIPVVMMFVYLEETTDLPTEPANEVRDAPESARPGGSKTVADLLPGLEEAPKGGIESSPEAASTGTGGDLWAGVFTISWFLCITHGLIWSRPVRTQIEEAGLRSRLEENKRRNAILDEYELQAPGPEDSPNEEHFSNRGVGQLSRMNPGRLSDDGSMTRNKQRERYSEDLLLTLPRQASPRKHLRLSSHIKDYERKLGPSIKTRIVEQVDFSDPPLGELAARVVTRVQQKLKSEIEISILGAYLPGSDEVDLLFKSGEFASFSQKGSTFCAMEMCLAEHGDGTIEISLEDYYSDAKNVAGIILSWLGVILLLGVIAIVFVINIFAGFVMLFVFGYGPDLFDKIINRVLGILDTETKVLRNGSALRSAVNNAVIAALEIDFQVTRDRVQDGDS